MLERSDFKRFQGFCDDKKEEIKKELMKEKESTTEEKQWESLQHHKL